MSPSHVELEVPTRARGQRLDHVLAQLVPEQSRAWLQKLVRRGRVRLDGRRVLRSNVTLRGGERLELVGLPGRAEDNGRAEPPALTVLHEDEHLVVVDKPAGVLTHPTERLAGGTIAERAVARYGPLPSAEDACRPGIVHRLDRDTSGVLVLARTDAALADLREQFRHGRVAKTYIALVHGRPAFRERRVDLALGPIPGEPDRQRVDPRGRAATTEVRVRRVGERFALVACRPHTGRRHQIRVHLAALGHPVVGDALYRPASGVQRVRGLGRHLLHAARLELDHPAGRGRMGFDAAPPPELEALLDQD